MNHFFYKQKEFYICFHHIAGSFGRYNCVGHISFVFLVHTSDIALCLIAFLLYFLLYIHVYIDNEYRNESQIKLRFYITVSQKPDLQGHIGTGPHHCPSWESNPHRGINL